MSGNDPTPILQVNETRRQASQAGFIEEQWDDVTDNVLQGLQRTSARYDKVLMEVRAFRTVENNHGPTSTSSRRRGPFACFLRHSEQRTARLERTPMPDLLQKRKDTTQLYGGSRRSAEGTNSVHWKHDSTIKLREGCV